MGGPKGRQSREAFQNPRSGDFQIAVGKTPSSLIRLDRRALAILGAPPGRFFFTEDRDPKVPNARVDFLKSRLGESVRRRQGFLCASDILQRTLNLRRRQRGERTMRLFDRIDAVADHCPIVPSSPYSFRIAPMSRSSVMISPSKPNSLRSKSVTISRESEAGVFFGLKLGYQPWQIIMLSTSGRRSAPS